MKLAFLRALRSMVSGSDLDRVTSVSLEEFRDPRAASALRSALSRRQFLAGMAAVAITAPLAPKIFLPASRSAWDSHEYAYHHAFEQPLIEAAPYAFRTEVSFSMHSVDWLDYGDLVAVEIGGQRRLHRVVEMRVEIPSEHERKYEGRKPLTRIVAQSVHGGDGDEAPVRVLSGHLDSAEVLRETKLLHGYADQLPVAIGVGAPLLKLEMSDRERAPHNAEIERWLRSLGRDA